MRVLLTGHRGQLGQALKSRLSGQVDLVSSDHRTDSGLADGLHLDLSRPDSVAAALDSVKPELIINAAAYTAVDKAESEPEVAHAVNAESVTAMAQWCAQHAARLIHYSTDYVFDGESTIAYSENDPTAPVSAYGQSKRDGELGVIESGCSALIFRTAWVYANHGHNFLNTMIRLANNEGPLRVVNDQLGTPTHAASLASLSLKASERWLDGTVKTQGSIFNLSSTGDPISWYQFACTLFSEMKRRNQISRIPEVKPIPGSAYPTPAVRPAWSVLDNHLFETTFGLKVPHWHDQLRQCCDARLAIS